MAFALNAMMPASLARDHLYMTVFNNNAEMIISLMGKNAQTDV